MVGSGENFKKKIKDLLHAMEIPTACMSIIQCTNPEVCLLINTYRHLSRKTFNTFILHPRLLILLQLDAISMLQLVSLCKLFELLVVPKWHPQHKLRIL